MLKRLSTDTVNLILLIGAVLLVMEVVFFNGGLIFSVAFSGLLIYLGWTRYAKLWGKVIFWIGAVSLFITAINMIAVRFLIIAALVMAVLHYHRSRNEPKRIEPEIVESQLDSGDPVLRQKFFGNESTPGRAYKWQDINIHGGFGERVVDLSNTVLPEGEAVISIRHLIGSVYIYVPYEVEVSVEHSSVFGRASIFQYRNTKLINQIISYQTPEYSTRKPRVKIITSIGSGDIEVKRI
ncbi:cell wall-active antibiotics response protein LiaF [Halobacillus sp. A5]|uniref:cell wall-active antibiotics response protein LiaF n=1 Tax=Halobacillus sp. A5 TaxID=2880263 RepID=UPI0020A66B5D|nr:cell wall-active antibiotics response protein LiaF [Halobacillus sp. A5]MCP3027429.1 cell wall-active antibiotics response protein LiaF [Halobacillus sp. A5]